MKIGIFTPTASRPYHIRATALQFNAQTRLPDLVCFHQNNINGRKSYEKFIRDLDLKYDYHWMLTDRPVSVEERYFLPAKYLLDNGCDYMFYCDDDDVYYSDHIEKSIDILESKKCDLLIRNHCDVMKFDGDMYDYSEKCFFTSHANSGVSSSMVFSKRFAEHFIQDCIDNMHQRSIGGHFLHHCDEIINWVTANKFIKYVSEDTTMCYVVHRYSSTSSGWL